jgi:hypothetical protein
VQERRFLENLTLADVVVVRPHEMRLHRGERILLRFVPEELLAAEEPAEEAPVEENAAG